MKRKSIITLAMAAILALSSISLTGCGNGGGSKADATKTHLSVLNYDGGIGSEWLKRVAERFEAKYADVSFEEGKKGVVIDITNNKNDGSEGVTNTSFAVWFSESNAYNDLIASGQVVEITDIVTESLSDASNGAETGTIEDKLSEAHKEAMTAIDGKYYCLPHYEVYTGLVYDVDLFDEYGYYFSETGNFTNVAEEKTVGPDGVRGTKDDGLPSSYEELYTLMDQMVADGVTPFTWVGQHENYANDLFAGLQAAYAGKDELLLNVTFDSSASNTQATIVEFEGNKAVEKKVDINSQNGYLMSQQAAKYYAYELFEKIMSSDSYHTKLDKSTSHLDTQEKFILSSLKAGESPIAMMIEGSYWYNEATEALKRSVNTYKEQAEGRRFGWMPLPVQYSGSVTEGNGRKNTVLETLNSFAFINARYKDDEAICKLAKLFLQFCYTDESLVDFSITTGLPKGVNYTIPEDKLAEIDNYFQRDLLETKMNSDVVYPYSAHPIFINDQGNFMFQQGSEFWAATIDGEKFANYFAANKVGITAKEYFVNAAIDKKTWEEKYGEFLK
ncbi:MAG: hypothetical protein IJE23_03995 [Tyzzerella sp.]|nr:hypothetical protein [Tyzzerella sp.]